MLKNFYFQLLSVPSCLAEQRYDDESEWLKSLIIYMTCVEFYSMRPDLLLFRQKEGI